MNKLLLTCMNLNKKKDYDVFFIFSGHVERVMVTVNYKENYEKDTGHHCIYEKKLGINESTDKTIKELIETVK